jgi:hypothetical protein
MSLAWKVNRQRNGGSGMNDEEALHGLHFLADPAPELSRLVGLSSIVPLVPPHPKPCTPGPQSTRSADFSPQQAAPPSPHSIPSSAFKPKTLARSTRSADFSPQQATPPSRVHSLQRLQAEDVGSTDTERGLQSAAGRPHPAPIPSPPAPSSRRRWLDRHGARTSVRSRPTPPSPRSIPFSAFKPKTLARSTRSTGLHPHEAFEMLRNKFRAPSKLGRSGSREADVHGGGGLMRSADFSPQHSRTAGRPFKESRIGDSGYHSNIQLRCGLRNTRVLRMGRSGCEREAENDEACHGLKEASCPYRDR